MECVSFSSMLILINICKMIFFRLSENLKIDRVIKDAKDILFVFGYNSGIMIFFQRCILTYVVIKWHNVWNFLKKYFSQKKIRKANMTKSYWSWEKDIWCLICFSLSFCVCLMFLIIWKKNQEKNVLGKDFIWNKVAYSFPFFVLSWPLGSAHPIQSPCNNFKN